jgi:hypothetical protein
MMRKVVGQARLIGRERTAMLCGVAVPILLRLSAILKPVCNSTCNRHLITLVCQAHDDVDISIELATALPSLAWRIHQGTT